MKKLILLLVLIAAIVVGAVAFFWIGITAKLW